MIGLTVRIYGGGIRYRHGQPSRQSNDRKNKETEQTQGTVMTIDNDDENERM